MSEWKVHRSKCRCKTCDIEIEAGQFFWSRLVDNDEPENFEVLKREDCCEAHWPLEGEAFCFWRTQRNIEEDLGPRMLDYDTLLTIFRELPEDSEEPRKQNFRYLLALILMRKKILKEFKKGSKNLKLTDTVTEWTVPIPDMDQEARKLAEEDIGQLIIGLPETDSESDNPEEEEPVRESA
jgi:hypothetical protein